jgi:hypothetical protein
MKLRRRDIRKRAKERLAADLGITVPAMEKKARRMARAAKELGVGIAKMKLERHGMKLTKAEELEIARQHTIMTLAARDIGCAIAAMTNLPAPPPTVIQDLEYLKQRILNWRPREVCRVCGFTNRSVCQNCGTRGWF